MLTITFIYPGSITQTREYSPDTMNLHGVKLGQNRPLVAYAEWSNTSTRAEDKEWAQGFLFRQVTKTLYPCVKGNLILHPRLHKDIYG